MQKYFTSECNLSYGMNEWMNIIVNFYFTIDFLPILRKKVRIVGYKLTDFLAVPNFHLAIYVYSSQFWLFFFWIVTIYLTILTFLLATAFIFRNPVFLLYLWV